jgi:hypothetical protein
LRAGPEKGFISDSGLYFCKRFRYMIARYCATACLLLLASASAWAQTGRIVGTVTDPSGQPLPGVNVVIDGTSTGNSSNIDGYYSIIGVSPGSYTLRASFIGFATQRIEQVRVNADQSTTVDIVMTEEALEGEEVVVTATAPILDADVSSSRLNLSEEQIEALPTASIAGVLALQAGTEGLSIRGSGADELSFNVNGLTLRDERSNSPYTNIPLASVEALQVVTSGFNAEYGNVRSGLINVTTKEGSRDRYEVDVALQYSPPDQKNFGQNANDLDSYWVRPFTDPTVAYTGTDNGAWDEATQRQYPEFEGWISVSESLLADDDPTNDATPEALYQAFLFQHSKRFQINQPDYVADIGIGGPMPFLNRWGGTRFHVSYKGQQDMYLVPLHTDRSEQQTGLMTLTSDVAPGVKVQLQGLYGVVDATSASRTGNPGIFASASGIAGNLSRVSFINSRIFSTDYWAPTQTRDFMLGARMTHAIGERTYYEVRASRYASFYDTNPGPLRDSSDVFSVGGVTYARPFGFQPAPSNGVNGLRMGVGMSNARDTSRVTVYNLKADLTHQFTPEFEGKVGLEYNRTFSNINYGSFDAFLQSSNFRAVWDREPIRASAYAQSTLEFKGLIANLGLRLDYSDAGGEWYDYDLYDPALANRLVLDTLQGAPTEAQWALMPRLGVSFPITVFSKLYFNYGHFRSMPSPDDLYQLRYASETGQVTRIADPNAPLPKTVAYEIGYEHAFFDQYRVKVAGYYKDVSLEPRLVEYTSRSGRVNYLRSEPNNYADIRGFELDLRRERGNWLRGFFNYTYSVRTSGRFGLTDYFENPTQQRQIENSDALRRSAQSRPIPQPFARLNLDFITPANFGPSLAGVKPLADFRISALGSWREGGYLTWVGGGSIEGVENNLQFIDFTNLNLRISKAFRTSAGRKAELFVDVFNALNQRRLSFNGFVDGNDYLDYMRSLHLPESDVYTNIPGDDRPGEFRREDVAFVPITTINSRDQVTTPIDGRLYYERGSGQYFEYRGGAFVSPDAGRLDQVLEDKAYIDMPNQGFLTFLDPRDIYFGVRFSF